MNESDNLLNELKSIRDIMERSSRFLSLSGWSGILIGIYALAGAFLTHRILSGNATSVNSNGAVFTTVLLVALAVLLVSLFTIFILTIRKAQKENKTIWGPGSKLLLLNLLIPLATGAILVSVFALRANYDYLCAILLIFYGLALVNAAKYTRHEILGLGIAEIIIGLFAAIFPVYGILFWALGFGVLHFVYGVLFLRLERKKQ